jgi:dUTPase
MVNNIGIIDQSYTGEVMMALMKHDEEAEEIDLPCRIAQLIPRKWMNVSGVEVDMWVDYSSLYSSLY